jgi:putative RecB family exonuclease
MTATNSYPPTLVAVEMAEAGNPSARLSPTQISAFRKCGLRYWFSYLLGWREPPTPALAAGTIVHDTLEGLYRLPAPDRSFENAWAIMGNVGKELLLKPEYEHLGRGANRDDVRKRADLALTGYFELEKPTQIDVAIADIETDIDAELSGVLFHGRLDRRTRQPIDRVTDYKTGKKPSGAPLDDYVQQVLFYAAAINSGSDPGVEEVELLFLPDKQAVRRPVYPAAIARVTEVLIQTRAEIDTAMQSGEWLAQPSRLCNYCPFKPVCPTQQKSAPIPGSAASQNLLSQTGLQRKVSAATIEAADPDFLPLELSE